MNEELAAAGLPVIGGRRPLGYTRDQLHIEPVEAEIVRDLGNRPAQSVGLGAAVLALSIDPGSGLGGSLEMRA